MGAEELYKLNEAIFNLPEEDNVDSQTGSKVFAFLNFLFPSFMLSKFACGLWVQTISKHHDYLYVRLYWTEFGFEANVIEEYILFTALLHEVVAQKRTWDTSINYIFASGKSNFDSELHACDFMIAGNC